MSRRVRRPSSRSPGNRKVLPENLRIGMIFITDAGDEQQIIRVEHRPDGSASFYTKKRSGGYYYSARSKVRIKRRSQSG